MKSAEHFSIIMSALCLMGIFCSDCWGQSPSWIDTCRSASAQGFITVKSEIDSLQIFLDDSYLGTTPLLNVPVDTGKHTLWAINPKRANWAEHDRLEHFFIHPDDSMFFDITFTTYYYINSTPFGALVLYNNKVIGRTPLHYGINPGQNDLIIVRKEGYLDFAIRPGSSAQQYFDVKLQLDKMLEEEKVKYSVGIKHRHSRKKLLTYSAIGLSIASGLGSIYLKKLADRKYDDYLNAADPDQMDRLYQDTKRLDTYAGISYGVFQVSFVASIYLFLKGRN
ncbi:PEGA domain-containing protein [candidate division KSB1 bacterium]|nr:PEGA domain-containing protein [candidate division KSB1 bacterium]